MILVAEKVWVFFSVIIYMTAQVIQLRSFATRQITGSGRYIGHAVSELLKGAH